MTTSRRRTLARAVTLTGRGLHTGRPVTATLQPAAAGGVVFRRMDLPGQPTVPARLASVTGTYRRTELRAGRAAVSTVEHLLAALYAAGIDDAEVALDGPEPPAGDGSARLFVAALQDAGVREHPGRPGECVVRAPLSVRDGDARYRAAPAEDLVLDVRIEWPHPLIGRQAGRWRVTPAAFAAELADARTFGLLAEQERLTAQGLALGASGENTIVLTATGLAAGALRRPDEFVRHKAVDLLGDLALLGARLRAVVVAECPSHRGNLALVRALTRHAIEKGAIADGHPGDPADPAAPLSSAAGGPDRGERAG